jgi:hypothetical protein
VWDGVVVVAKWERQNENFNKFYYRQSRTNFPSFIESLVTLPNLIPVKADVIFPPYQFGILTNKERYFKRKSFGNLLIIKLRILEVKYLASEIALLPGPVKISPK